MPNQDTVVEVVFRDDFRLPAKITLPLAIVNQLEGHARTFQLVSRREQLPLIIANWMAFAPQWSRYIAEVIIPEEAAATLLVTDDEEIEPNSGEPVVTGEITEPTVATAQIADPAKPTEPKADTPVEPTVPAKVTKQRKPRTPKASKPRAKRST